MKKTITSFKIKISLVEDIKFFRDYLRNKLQEKEGIRVINDSANGLKAIESIGKDKPDIVITDLLMPVMDGFQFINEINKTNPDIKILVYSSYLNPMTNAKLVGHGVCGFLDKDFDLTELFKAIFEAHKVGHYFNQYYTQAIADFVKDPKMNGYFMPESLVLKDDDIKLIELIWDELNNKELAKEFKNDKRTIQRNSLALIKKMNCKSIIGVLKYAQINGIINLKEKYK